jgi:hypothetical protein
MSHKKVSYVVIFALILTASLVLAQTKHKRSKSGQQTAAQSLSINVTSSAPPPLAITTTTLPDGKVGVSYSSTLAATGGTPPYNWAVTTGTLPDGLALDAAGGVIAGNPTQAQSKTFTITVTDSSGGVPPQPSGDNSVIIIPNPTFSVSDGQSKPLSTIGNVTGQPISATWSISPANGNASLSAASGSSVTFSCGSNGHTGSPYTIAATVAGLTAGTTSGSCLAASSQTVINSTDCSPAALSAAWGQMTAGAYVIQLPSSCGSSGTYTSQWSPGAPPGAVTSVTLSGSTAVNCTGTAGTSNWTCAPTDKTIIIDNYSSHSALWNLNTGASSTFFRVTGITFQGSPSLGTAYHKPDGFLIFGGASQNFRVDHIHINANTYQTPNFSGGMTIYGMVYGVVDHIRSDNSWQQNGVRSYGVGDAAWAAPTQLGGDNFLFVENNEFVAGFVNDCNYGARQVVRYNTSRAQTNDTAANSGGIQTHVTAQGDPNARGCRVLEMYHNYQMNPTPSYPTYAASDGSSATGVRWGDTVATGINNDIGFLGHIGRTLSANNCGGGGGNAGACQAPPNGYGYCGSGSSGVFSVWDGNTNAAGYPCIDQTGRGQSDLLSGSFPNRRNTTTGCVPTSPPGCSVWPHNKREPWYVWNETITGHPVCFSVYYNGVAMATDRDYYCQVSSSAQSSPTSPFNGTTGTGFGTLSNRPSTCAAGPGGAYDTSPTGSYGVGYFATDDNSGNGVLYVCTAANVWTNIYTPYTYPHPLTLAAAFAAPFDWTPVIWIALLALAVAVYFLRKPIIKRFAKKGPDA